MTINLEKFKSPSVFIVSSGRSGTTLLASILNASKQIVIPYESDFLARAYPFCNQKNDYTNYDYQLLVKIFKQSAKADGWGMSEEYLLNSLNKRSPINLNQIISVFCEAYHKQESNLNLLWGIKSPVLISSLEKISDTYPKAKIIHIVRDGRDVFLSYRKVHDTSQVKFGPRGIIQNALYWVDGLRRVEEFTTNHSDSQIYQLRYEDLLHKPTETIERLCSFLGINYHHSMHDDYNNVQANRKVVPKQFADNIHKKVGNGLDSKNTYKYLNGMSPVHKIIYELLAGPYLLKYSYKLEMAYLNNILFHPLRILLYTIARFYNNWRYSKRDNSILRHASHST